MGEKRNIILEKSFEFSVSVIYLSQNLRRHGEYVIAQQLLKSGTSIGVNIEEATAAQSRKDFISKMAIASKEARETKYWIRLVDRTNLVQTNLKDIFLKVEELIRLLTAIVKSSSDKV